MKTDTIAAIATAMSSSGIGIVRISGAEAVSIAEQVFELKSKKKLSEMKRTKNLSYEKVTGCSS